MNVKSENTDSKKKKKTFNIYKFSLAVPLILFTFISATLE